MKLESEKKFDVLILFSGGADSALMVDFAVNNNLEPYCLLIDYSQLHNEELEFAKRNLESWEIYYQVVEVKGLKLDSALTGDGKKSRFGDHVSEWHVPGRNTMFAGIAFSVAENLGIKEIWLGADYSDIIGNFVDCQPEFINKVDELFQIAGSYPIKFRAPLLGLDKETILNMLEVSGISKDEIYSGYGELDDDKDKESSFKNPFQNINQNQFDINGLNDLENYIKNNLKENENYAMRYKEYISLPTFFEDPKNTGELFGNVIYRKEGFDPLVHGYGIVYRFIFDGKVDFNKIDDYKHSCDIVDLNDFK